MMIADHDIKLLRNPDFQAQNRVCRLFLKFGSLVFLEIAYNDSFQQCLTSSRGKTHIKKLEAQIWAKLARIRSKISHFLKFVSLVFLQIAYDGSLQQCLISSRSKSDEKTFAGPNLGQTSQNRVQN